METTVWLVFMAWTGIYDQGFGGFSQKFPMQSMEQCEKAKVEFIEVLSKNRGTQKVKRPLYTAADYEDYTFCFEVPE